MIWDQVCWWPRWAALFTPEAAAAVGQTLRRFAAGMPDGSGEVIGRDLRFAVAVYPTQARERCRRESHRDFIDLQMVLAGGEGAHCCPVAGLAEETVYDPACDAQFFDRTAGGGVEFQLTPGYFALYFPGEGHLTGFTVSGADAPVRKAVIKIHRRFLAGR